MDRYFQIKLHVCEYVVWELGLQWKHTSNKSFDEKLKFIENLYILFVMI